MTAPARWRKAKFPDAGSRWDTPINRHIWHRDYGQDVELWSAGKCIAVVREDGSWAAGIRGTDGSWNDDVRRGRAKSVDEAKREAKRAAVVAIELHERLAGKVRP